MSHIKVDQFIMNLVDFLSPDDYIRPNPLVNACAFILVLGIFQTPVDPTTPYCGRYY